MPNRYGYYKISEITPERIMEPVATWENEKGEIEVIEQVCFEAVWIVAEGAVFEVTLLKGETLDQVAGRYRVGGYTDDRCTYWKELKDCNQ